MSLSYALIRAVTYPFGFMPYSWLRTIGKVIGSGAYYCMREYRKRALSNLALATDLALTPKETVQLAKKSFQNLAINCLEYPKLARDKHFGRALQCENPETANEIYAQGKGIIFFCGHLSNWEVPFLDGTSRMNGIAIGKPIRNKKLYKWILSIREKNGGKIVTPHNAIKEGFRALKKGHFIGIVGDQGMPDSGYSFPFLGRRAWTTTAPALLAYRTESPILFAQTHRTKTGYKIRYSEPLWPDLTRPMEEEVVRMMNALLKLLQESIRLYPGEWLWQHNRWKQQTPQNLYKRFRQDCICIILPMEERKLQLILPHLQTLKTIYPKDFIFLIAPEKCRSHPLIETDETYFYQKIEETLRPDLRFKLIFNFADYAPIPSYYENLSAFEVIDLDILRELARPYLPAKYRNNLSEIFKRALCRPGTLWSNDAS